MAGYGGYAGAALGVAGAISNMMPGQKFNPKAANIKARKKYSTEWRANRGEIESANSGRNQNDAAAADMNSINPILYRLAGIEGDFSGTPQNARAVADAQGKVDRLTASLGTTKAGQGRRVAAKGKLTAAQAALKKEQDSVASQATHISNAHDVGLGDENDKAIDKLMGDRVRHALETGQSDDPRLNRQLAEEQGATEAGLAARGLNGSSLGATAMAAFNQRKNESLADFARKDVSEYNPMRLMQRESLADIAGKRQELAMAPMKARLGISSAMNATSARYGETASRYQQERIKQAELALEAEKFRSQTTFGSQLMQAGGATAIAAAGGGGGGGMGRESGNGGSDWNDWSNRVGDFFGNSTNRDYEGAMARNYERSY